MSVSKNLFDVSLRGALLSEAKDATKQSPKQWWRLLRAPRGGALAKTVREHAGLLIVLALMAAYSVYFSAYSIQRQYTFRTYASDMGQMDQALWNTLHGNWLQDTRPDGHNAPRLTDHVEPIFFVVPLVFLIYSGIESLFVLQSVAIALGALPIFWIAQRRLKSDWAAVAFAAMYLLFPALQAANLAEFHAVTLAPAPLLFAFNYAEERAWKRYVLFSLIALAVQEDVALLVFAMAVWAAVQSTVASRQSPDNRQQTTDDGQQTTDRRFTIHVSRFTFHVSIVPAIISIFSIVWFLFAVFVIVPHFSPGGRSVYVGGRYPWFSRNPIKLIEAIPQIVASLLVPAKWAYVLQMLASSGVISLLDPATLLVGSPLFVLNLLSSYPAQYSGTYHYSAPVAPYFVLAAIGGAAAIRNGFGALRHSQQFAIRKFGSRALAIAVVPAFLIALGYQAIAGYTPLGGQYFWPSITPHDQLLARFVKEIPPDVPASTTSTLFPHLSHRLKLYRFPTILDAQYILLDVSQANTTNPVDFREAYLNALKQGFGIRDAVDGYILLQRGLTQTTLPDGFYDFARTCPCAKPQHSVVIDFGDKIRFLGYDVRQDDWQRVYLRTYWTRLPGMDDNNYALFPFYPDANGAPRADAQLPDLTIQFWYPTSLWQPGEVVIADTLPIDVGARAKIGVGVFFGASWDNARFYLTPRTTAPVSADGRLVSIGEIARVGKAYQVVGDP